jgi:hypothetical protein
MNANTSAESIAQRGSCAAQAELVDRIARLTDGDGVNVGQQTLSAPMAACAT